MTQVGHALTGTAIGVLCLPQKTSLLYKSIHFGAFIALSLVLDYRLPYWGHDRYYISHSIFINMLLIFLVVLLLAIFRNVRTKIGGWNVIASGAVAWVSHLLLDSFYNHRKGVAIFWPVSKARLILPVPWLSAVRTLPPPITPELLRILWIEFITFSPLVLLAILIRSQILKTND